MKKHAGLGPEGLLFRGERGAILRRDHLGGADRDGSEGVAEAG
jgi:hypothetical protein